MGFGLPAFGDLFTATPELGFGFSNTGRDYRLGWRLAREIRPGDLGSLELVLEGTRGEPASLGLLNRLPSRLSGTDSICIRGYSAPYSVR